jgi:hypothetical protein
MRRVLGPPAVLGPAARLTNLSSVQRPAVCLVVQESHRTAPSAFPPPSTARSVRWYHMLELNTQAGPFIYFSYPLGPFQFLICLFDSVHILGLS